MGRKMKDSGIEWIGEIPEDWKVSKLKRFVIISSGEFLEKRKFIDDGNIEVIGANGKLGNYCKANLNKKAIITGRVGTIGTLYLKENVWITDNVLSIDVLKGNLKFFYYYLHILNFQEMSNTTAQPLITASKLNNITVVVPGSEEQIRISSFLESKTKEIDRIKQLINQEIQTLEDYKKSVITEAVTKGLDKNVEMKDSGIEWIGEIPKHWSKIKLRYLSNIVRGGSPRPINEYMSNSDEDLNWIKIGDTQKGSKYINKTKNKLKTTGLSSTTFVKKGELILSNSMSYGEAYILNIDGCIHDGWLAFKDIKNVDKEYLYFSLLSFNTKIQFDKLSDGGVVQNLNIDKVKTVYIFLPDKKEQVEIANYLNKTIKSIDESIESKQKQLEVLEDYKKSLIYEYVTGKKEVGDAHCSFR